MLNILNSERRLTDEQRPLRLADVADVVGHPDTWAMGQPGVMPALAACHDRERSVQYRAFQVRVALKEATQALEHRQHLLPLR